MSTAPSSLCSNEEARANERTRFARRWILPALLAVVAATLAAYWRVGSCDFVNLDDDAYVQYQPMVNQGVRAPALVWALTAAHSNNWHPLTTLTHMLDCQLFGVRAAPMHWENLVWHILNSVLVFAVWRALTGTLWRSILVSALFALHPLHVESVAWIAERKDVLSAFFWLLGLWAYARYTRAPSVGRYLAVAAAMLLALLSKPMAVTFPCTLLLLDFWPLRRWPDRSWRALLVEKLPLFAVVAGHSVITFLVQNATGAANFGQRLSLGARVGNALVSYVRYAGKTVWPESLSPLYYHPGYWPTLLVIGSTAALLLVTALVIWQWRARPWLAFGWLWFLGTLVPVIGIVQVGAQALADRYMYVPILGLFTMLAWSASEIASVSLLARRVVLAVVVIAIVALAAVTGRQVPAWTNSITLYERSIAAGEDNAAIRYLLATAMAVAGRPESEVVAQFQRALQLRPDYINAMTQLASIALARGRTDEARELLERALQAEPQNPTAHSNFGAYWVRVGRPELAVPLFEQALRLDPALPGAHEELGKILLAQNRAEEGRQHFEARAKAERWNPDALCDYGTLVGNMRRFEEAFRYLERALWIRPDFPRARLNLEALRQAAAQLPPPQKM